MVRMRTHSRNSGMGETRRAIGGHLLPLPPSRARVGLPSCPSLDPKTQLALPSSQPRIRQQEKGDTLHVNDLDTQHVSIESHGIPYMSMIWVRECMNPRERWEIGFCLMATSHLLEGQVFDGGTRQYYAIVRFVLDLAESLVVGIHCEDRGGLRDKEFACVTRQGAWSDCRCATK